MMFIIRTLGETPAPNGFTIRLTRRTPAVSSGGTLDFFCDGDPEAAKRQQFNVVMLHDGWYADDSGGGVAVWGQGLHWEIRDTPFSVRESSAGATASSSTEHQTGDEMVDVRKGIFGV
jgi:hypothetical protein